MASAIALGASLALLVLFLLTQLPIVGDLEDDLAIAALMFSPLIVVVLITFFVALCWTRGDG